MASNANHVYAAEPLTTGSLLVAPLGTSAPTDAVSALTGPWVDLGYIGEDGFTETIDRSIEKKKAFGGDTVKILQTDYAHTFSFTLLESLNANVLKAVYGEDNVTVTPANGSHGVQIKVNKNARKLKKMSWVIDTTDTELDAFYRNYIPIGQITSVGDVTIVHTDTIMYEVELEAFPNADGNYVITFTDDGQKTS